MHLFGLTLVQLVSFLGAGVLVVTLLYRLKVRRRTVVVSFAPLWRRVVRDRPASSLFERLRRLMSLLLQVAFVFLLLLAISRPRLASDAERERRFVLVIDAGAAMQALTDLEGPPRTRLDEAKDQVRSLIRRFGETDRAMIVSAGLTPRPETLFETDRRPLLDATDRLRPLDCRSDLAEAVRFARSLVPGSPGRVFVFTDRPPEADFAHVQWRQVGKPLDNLAVTRFAARTALESPGEYELLFEVRNFGEAGADVRLRIESAAATPVLIEDRPLALPGGAGVSDVIRGIAAEDVRLVARLTRADGSDLGDGLPLDNRAFTVVRAPRLSRVTVVGAENFFLDSVLKSDPLIRFGRVAPGEFEGAGDADVVIFDNCAPPAAADRAIYIHPTSDGSPVKNSGEIKDVFVDALSDGHPVMRFVGRLADLNIAQSQVLAAQPGDTVLASCAGSPVMLAREQGGRRLVALGFDLTDSDLVLRVAFPKIFRNAIGWLVSGEVGEETTTLLAGEPVPMYREEGRFVPRRVGFEEIGGRTVAVNLCDEQVSDLRSVPAPARTQTAEFTFAATTVGWELWPALVVLAMALTFLEWISYHRRWTV